MHSSLGKARGPRAARRIVFELSWRLFGQKRIPQVGGRANVLFRKLGAINDILLKEGLAA